MEFHLDDSIDEFLQNVRDKLENLSEENIEQQSSDTLSLITTLPDMQIDAIAEIILQLVCQLKAASSNFMLISLVKRICVQSNSHELQNRNDYFRERLRKNSLLLLANASNLIEQQPIIVEDIGSINSLDKQVNRIDVIRFNCANIRHKRIAHFVGHLFKMNVVSLTDVFDINAAHPLLKEEFLAKNHDIENCCDFELPPNVETILHSDYFQHVKHIEEHLFWVHNKVKFVYLSKLTSKM